jgi:uncharacterized protein (DUF302 family)
MSEASRGVVDRQSRHGVDETVAKLEGLLKAKGVTLFVVVDHSGEAAKVGFEMRPTKLLVFGSPKAGTPPMLATPRLALDLPLKALVWEDADGRVWISTNSAAFLQERHGAPPEHLAVLAAADALAIAASG